MKLFQLFCLTLITLCSHNGLLANEKPSIHIIPFCGLRDTLVLAATSTIEIDSKANPEISSIEHFQFRIRKKDSNQWVKNDSEHLNFLEKSLMLHIEYIVKKEIFERDEIRSFIFELFENKIKRNRSAVRFVFYLVPD